MSPVQKFLIPIGVGILIGSSLVGLLYFPGSEPASSSTDPNSAQDSSRESRPSPDARNNSATPAVKPPQVTQFPSPDLPDSAPIPTPFTPSGKSPQDIATSIARALQSGKKPDIDALVDAGILSLAERQALETLLSRAPLKLDPKQPIAEVGELERQNKFRWALNLADGRRILLDIHRQPDGKWKAEKATIIPAPDANAPDNTPLVEIEDPLGVTDAFLRATINQKFSQARYLVNPEKVNDATIAGLCIIFEEGEYSLKPDFPLRHLFGTEKTSGYLGYVVSRDRKQAGTIGITLEKAATGKWKISDVMLDNILQDYTKNFGDGDEFFIPIVKNPKGGDSLALFFGFNESLLSPRSQKQLRIVAEMLKADPSRKIRISGHTDDVGSENYNQQLSEARAEAVKQALINGGLNPDQIVTLGFGKKQPRRNPVGQSAEQMETARRVNRRAEIYLDF